MPRSVAEIQAEIAKVKQEIATRDMYRQPQSRVGWASYVGNGDRGLLDAYQNREDQYNKMMKQQQFQAAERALQQKFQAAEAEKNRQNAKEIAAINKANDIEAKKDEYRRSRNKAASVLNYAQQALSQDPNNIQLQKEAKLAKEDFDYYDRKLGGQGYDNIAVQPKQSSDGLDNNQVNTIVKAIVDKKSYTNADRNKLQVLSEFVTDPTIKEQINTILSNKGPTKEDMERAELKDLQDKRNNGENMTTKQQKRLKALEAKYK